MKRKTSALTLILVLSILSVALQFVSMASANFIGAIILPNEPNTTPPTIVVHSPVQNEACNSADLWLNFTIIKPKGFFGNVTSVFYTLDGGERQIIEVHDDSIYPPIKELNFSSNLKLSAGWHHVKVSIEAQSFYIVYTASQGWVYPSVLVDSESDIVHFNQALVVETTSPENKTYDSSSVPLNFVVNAVTSQIMYCLDGEENVSITGNTTLTGLVNQDHNLTLFAKDEAGNIAASETIFFTVEVPEIPEPQPEPFPTTMVIAPSASVAIIGAGLLVYFKKRMHQAEMVGSK